MSASERAAALRDAAEHFGSENFSHTVTTPTLFTAATPGRYGDSRDEMTGHLLQRHDRLMVQRWLRAEADRIEAEKLRADEPQSSEEWWVLGHPAWPSGTDFPTQRVNVSGLGYDGLYEVVDIRHTSKVWSSTDDLVGLRGDLALQSCFYGQDQMKFVGLERILELPDRALRSRTN